MFSSKQGHDARATDKNGKRSPHVERAVAVDMRNYSRTGGKSVALPPVAVCPYPRIRETLSYFAVASVDVFFEVTASPAFTVELMLIAILPTCDQLVPFVEV
jgi:hypothetical protein